MYVCFTHIDKLLIIFLYSDYSVYFHEQFLLIWITPKNLSALVSFLLSI